MKIRKKKEEEILNESFFIFHENEYQNIECYDLKKIKKEMEYSNFIEFDKNKIKKNDAILENYHKLIKFLDIRKNKR